MKVGNGYAIGGTSVVGNTRVGVGMGVQSGQGVLVGPGVRVGRLHQAVMVALFGVSVKSPWTKTQKHSERILQGCGLNLYSTMAIESKRSHGKAASR